MGGLEAAMAQYKQMPDLPGMQDFPSGFGSSFTARSSTPALHARQLLSSLLCSSWRWLAHRPPGGVLIVLKEGEVCFLEAFGVMDIEGDKPMCVDAMFRAASMTKITTSLAV
eukprot:COSAG02_NODE_42160_length_387_cov_0.767361_1_plen_111_part_10